MAYSVYAVAAGTQIVWPLDENISSGQPIQQQVVVIAGARGYTHPATEIELSALLQ